MSEHYYLWGAGNVGKRALAYLAPLGILDGIIDNSPAKQGQHIYGLEVYGYEKIKSLLRASGVIIAHFEPVKTEELLARDSIRSWRLAEFIPMWFQAQKHQNAVGFLDFPITTRCSLNCRDCMQYIPYRKKKDIPLESLKRDLDSLFWHISFVGEMSIIGGEPFLHEQLPELLEYIGDHYRNQIGSLVITTNGTIVPEDWVLDICSRIGVFISISDYSKTLQKLEGKIENLEFAAQEAGISIERKRWSWTVPGRFDAVNDNVDCTMSHMQLMAGKLWRCTLMAAGSAAGFCSTSDKYDYFDLLQGKVGAIQEFLTIDTLAKKTTQCGKCLSSSGIAVSSAIQI